MTSNTPTRRAGLAHVKIWNELPPPPTGTENGNPFLVTNSNSWKSCLSSVRTKMGAAFQTYSMPGDTLKQGLRCKFQKKRQPLRIVQNHWKNKPSEHSKKKDRPGNLTVIGNPSKSLGKQRFPSSPDDTWQVKSYVDPCRAPSDRSGTPLKPMEKQQFPCCGVVRATECLGAVSGILRLFKILQKRWENKGFWAAWRIHDGWRAMWSSAACLANTVTHRWNQ